MGGQLHAGALQDRFQLPQELLGSQQDLVGWHRPPAFGVNFGTFRASFQRSITGGRACFDLVVDGQRGMLRLK